MNLVDPTTSLTICLVSKTDAVASAVRVALLPPHTLHVFPLADLLDAETHAFTPAGQDVLSCAETADAVLLEWSSHQGPPVSMLTHAIHQKMAEHRTFVPLIGLCTGSTNDMLTAWEAGVDDVLQFPLHAAVLKARIGAYRRMVDRGQRQQMRVLEHIVDGGDETFEHLASAELQDAVHEALQGDAPDDVSTDDAPPPASTQALETAVERVARELVEEVSRVMHRLLDTERAALNAQHEQLTVGPLTLDYGTYRLYVEDESIELTPKEFDLLAYLMQQNGAVCTRHEILTDVWEMDFDTGTSMVDSYIYFLRQKLEPYGLRSVIETVRGRGYRLATDDA